MDMDFTMELYIYAIEQTQENNMWDLWKLQYPLMTKENYISFEDYKNKNVVKKHTKKSYEEIEKEMQQVENAFSERR